MSPVIRTYTPSDRADCQNVFYQSVRDGTAEFYDAEQRAAWAPKATYDPSKPDKLLDQWCWVAENENCITGFMSMSRGGYLDMAFVLPKAKGTGVADALYAPLLQQAKSAKLDTLTTHASHLARRFFAKHGWQQEYRERVPINGQVLERFHMTLDMKFNMIGTP